MPGSPFHMNAKLPQCDLAVKLRIWHMVRVLTLMLDHCRSQRGIFARPLWHRPIAHVCLPNIKMFMVVQSHFALNRDTLDSGSC